jgi:adenosylcobinamide kinase/adenosylcobinamide-phosphate guanylyltransferase
MPSQQAAPPAAARGRVLVLGGVRSGKSRFAESLLPAGEPATYVATGYPPDGADPEWAERVAGHRARRPAHWHTRETLEVADALRDATGTVLVDCLALWLTRVLDSVGAWTEAPGWEAALRARTGDLVDAWTGATSTVIAVSNEVGWGVVPDTRAGRVFRDGLGVLNTALAASADAVWLLVAGIPNRLR